MAHAPEPGAAVGVYDVLAVLGLGQCDLDVEEAVCEHDYVYGVFHGLDAELLSQVTPLLLPDAAHGELSDLLAVIAEIVGGPDHLVQDHAGPRRRRLPLVPGRPRQSQLHRPSGQKERESWKTVNC